MHNIDFDLLPLNPWISCGDQFKKLCGGVWWHTHVNFICCDVLCVLTSDKLSQSAHVSHLWIFKQISNLHLHLSQRIHNLIIAECKEPAMAPRPQYLLVASVLVLRPLEAQISRPELHSPLTIPEMPAPSAGQVEDTYPGCANITWEDGSGYSVSESLRCCSS